MPYSNGTGAIRPGGEPSTRHQAWGWREHPPRQRARRSGVRGCRMRSFLRLLMQVTQHIGRHREKGQFRQSASDCRPSRAGQIVVRPDAGRSANRDRRHRGTSGAGSWLDPRVSRQARLQSRCSIVDCFCADQKPADKDNWPGVGARRSLGSARGWPRRYMCFRFNLSVSSRLDTPCANILWPVG